MKNNQIDQVYNRQDTFLAIQKARILLNYLQSQGEYLKKEEEQKENQIENIKQTLKETLQRIDDTKNKCHEVNLYYEQQKLDAQNRFQDAFKKIDEETPIDANEHMTLKDEVENLKIKHKQMVDDYEERTKLNQEEFDLIKQQLLEALDKQKTCAQVSQDKTQELERLRQDHFVARQNILEMDENLAQANQINNSIVNVFQDLIKQSKEQAKVKKESLADFQSLVLQPTDKINQLKKEIGFTYIEYQDQIQENKNIIQSKLEYLYKLQNEIKILREPKNNQEQQLYLIYKEIISISFLLVAKTMLLFQELIHTILVIALLQLVYLGSFT